MLQFTHVTDGQTDRRTDRILIARPRLHSMRRGKKYSKYCRMSCYEIKAFNVTCLNSQKAIINAPSHVKVYRLHFRQSSHCFTPDWTKLTCTTYPSHHKHTFFRALDSDFTNSNFPEYLLIGFLFLVSIALAILCRVLD